MQLTNAKNEYWTKATSMPVVLPIISWRYQEKIRNNSFSNVRICYETHWAQSLVCLFVCLLIKIQNVFPTLAWFYVRAKNSSVFWNYFGICVFFLVLQVYHIKIKNTRAKIAISSFYYIQTQSVCVRITLFYAIITIFYNYYFL